MMCGNTPKISVKADKTLISIFSGRVKVLDKNLHLFGILVIGTQLLNHIEINPSGSILPYLVDLIERRFIVDGLERVCLRVIQRCPVTGSNPQPAGFVYK